MKKNAVIRVAHAGGIIGSLIGNDRNTLKGVIAEANADGWAVLQVIPDGEYNALDLLASLLVLIVTLWLWCPKPGFLIILEREVDESRRRKSLDDLDYR